MNTPVEADISLPETAEEYKVVLLPDTGQENSTIFILGPTGCGKTTLTANLLLQRVRFVVFDVKGEYPTEFFGEDVARCENQSAFKQYVNGGVYRIVYDMSRAGDNQEQQLDEALQFLFAFQLANKKNEDLPPVTIALDELNKFVEGQQICKGLIEVIQRGRAIKIKKIFGAQWFGDVPTSVRDSFTEIYAFRHNDKAGLMRLQTYGLDQETIQNLPQYTCAYAGKSKLRLLNLTPATMGKQPEQTKSGEKQRK